MIDSLPLMLKYIHLYNMIGSIICLSALALLFFKHYVDAKKFLFKIGCFQTFFLIDIINIIFGKTRAKLFPSILQLSSRLFIIWLICYKNSYNHFTVHLMLFAWFISDFARYIFYFSRYKIFKTLRYNLFIFLYPIGTFCEIVLTSRTEYISTGIYKYFLRAIILSYIPGFIYLFFHMLKRRKSTKAERKRR